MTNILMISESEQNANMYYASGFLAPDPFIYLKLRGQRMIILNELEYGRGCEEARVDRVLLATDILKAMGKKKATSLDMLLHLLKEARVRELSVPHNFSVSTADALRQKKIRVIPKSDPFFKERVIKTPEEIRHIRNSQRHTETAVKKAVDILRRSRIRKNRIYDGTTLVTAELIRRTINVSLMENNCIASHTIIASGDQGCNPHCQGTGPILPHQSLIMDVFPRSSQTLYFADMTRTVVKGTASPALKRVYHAVKAAQKKGVEMIRDGISGKKVHTEVSEVMKKRGFKTEKVNGQMVGFFHGTGHGVGLDIHEPPRVSKAHATLRAGMVVTVEPGLYYPGIGGVRIEDMVLVKKGGQQNLTRFPKVLEIP